MSAPEAEVPVAADAERRLSGLLAIEDNVVAQVRKFQAGGEALPLASLLHLVVSLTVDLCQVVELPLPLTAEEVAQLLVRAARRGVLG